MSKQRGGGRGLRRERKGEVGGGESGRNDEERGRQFTILTTCRYSSMLIVSSLGDCMWRLFHPVCTHVTCTHKMLFTNTVLYISYRFKVEWIQSI